MIVGVVDHRHSRPLPFPTTPKMAQLQCTPLLPFPSLILLGYIYTRRAYRAEHLTAAHRPFNELGTLQAFTSFTEATPRIWLEYMLITTAKTK